MKIVCVGAGGVGGYYGALLGRAGHDVAFVARGAHRDAIENRGISVQSAAVGNFAVPARADSDSRAFGPVDLVIFAVKTYGNPTALPLLPPLVGPDTTVLTLQNGVDSAEEVAAVVGESRTIAGATYVATEIASPGVIAQTGSHRRIVFGEYFGAIGKVSPRVAAIARVMTDADIEAEAVASARDAIWEKFSYLAPFAAFTGAARLPVGPLWNDAHARRMFLQAVEEVRCVARAHGVTLRADHETFITEYMNRMPPGARSSLLIDLAQGKPIEVEALQGAVVRRGDAVGVPTPIMSALYAVLKPHAGGASSPARPQ